MQRTELLLNSRKDSITSAIPIILALHSDSVQFIDKPPIVSISSFKSFLQDVENYLSEIHAPL